MENVGKSFWTAERRVGEPIEVSQIRKGDRIRKKAVDPSQSIQMVEYIAESAKDTKGFASMYNFILLEEATPPWEKYPTRLGAMIKVEGFVPAVLTQKGWQHISKYANLGSYHTAQELYERAASSGRYGFEVLYEGYESE